MLHLLDHLRRRAPVRFELLAVTVDQGYRGFQTGVLERYFKEKGYAYHIERTNIAGLTQEHLAITFEMAAPGLDGSLTTEWSTVVYQFDGNYFSGVYVYGTNKAQVQQLGSKLAVKAAHHLAEATAGKPGTGGGPFTSQAIPQDSGAQA